MDPTTYAPFAGFSCGNATPYEAEVNQIVRDLYSGRASGVFVRVAEDTQSGEFAARGQLADVASPPQ